jgi:hypothetical protein
MIPILLFLQVAAAAPASEDATLTEMLIVTTHNMPGMSADSAMRTRMRITYQDRRARHDRLEGVSSIIPATSPDSYLLIDGTTATFYVVDSVRKEFSKLDLAAMMEGAAGAMSALEGLQFSLKDVGAAADSLGVGETVLGYATNHWRLTQTMVISAGMGGDSSAMQMMIQQDFHYAPALEHLLGPTLYWLDSLEVSSPFERLFDPGTIEKFRAAEAKLPKGIPLKVSAAQTMMIGLEEVAMTITTEMTRVERVQRPPSFFMVPAGYKEVKPDLFGPDVTSQ